MRDIKIAWWHEGRSCRIFFDEGISFHDLWVEEVQALVDELQLKDVEPGYRPPEPRHDRFKDDHCWYNSYHPNRPGHTLRAFMDVCGENGEQQVWEVCYFGASVSLTRDEAEQLIKKFQALEGHAVNWRRDGF